VIPAIRDQQVFLDALTDAQWWTDVTVPMLEEARRRVHGLVRLIERSRRRSSTPTSRTTSVS
jgi:type I restriction enzyme, R subunit